MMTAPGMRGRAAAAVFWAGFSIFLVFALVLGGTPTQAAEALAWVTIGIAFGHATLGLGWRSALAFLALCLVITYSTENLSVQTGWPFGRYHFVVGAGFPHVGSIPLIVGFLYFGMGYPSWIVAGVLLDRPGAWPNTPFKLLAFPLVAAFVMVQWDAVMDPVSSTLGGAWVWHDGGGYFGVPLSNYVGWYLTVWLVFQAFSVVAFMRRGSDASVAAKRGRLFWLVPIVLYAGGGLCQIPPLFAGGDNTVVDAAGHVWHSRDLREATIVVMVSTMLATSVLAILRWLGVSAQDAGALGPHQPPSHNRRTDESQQ